MRYCVIISIVLLFKTFICQENSNNVCSRWWDYFRMSNNSNCWYDFAADAKAPEIIKKSGYPFMEFKVKTKDGYILKLFRIPRVSSTKPAVFLMHGMQSSCGIFLGLGKQSMAFLLYEAGYDVWLGNYRGSEYSEEHEAMNATQREYWDYSVDDIALKDIPAMLQLVSYYSRDRGKIIYIGHSLGTTLGMMFASEYPDFAANSLSLLVMMSPTYKLPNIRTPYRFLFPLLYPAVDISNALNLVQSVSRANLRNFTRPLCLSSPPLMIACLTAMNIFLGPFSQIAPETIPVYFNQIPGGTSLRTLTFLTESSRNRFRKYDYGIGKNRYLYGTDEPPEYDLKNIKVPVYIMFASNDWSISRQDCINFYKSLPERARYGMYEIRNLNFNHYDFLFGRNSKTLVVDKLIEVMDKFVSDNTNKV
ncbi:unnamed protein product [Phyllotreta striolata]|uniref:Lipase n=1 Tax=Phyllotreta striolata TaxID=444603 RepID=A0A9N9TLL9_PHYSR|nr:unnamed protein product [Phyllotreta striolata]